MSKCEIMASSEIEALVSKCKGTWVKRRNLRKKLRDASNAAVKEEIAIAKGKIRDLRAMGAREGDLRYWYAEVTHLEIMLIE